MSKKRKSGSRTKRRDLERKRKRRRRQSGERGQFESLEPRWLLTADLMYPADIGDTLITDITLVAEASGPDLFLKLYETSNLANEIASVQLDDAGDVDVDITRSLLPEAFSDTVRIDLDTFGVLDTFVTTNGGVLDIDFDGGTEIPLISNDHLIVEGTGTFALAFGLTLHATSDIVISTGIVTFGDDLMIDSDDSVEMSSGTLNTGANDLTLTASAETTGEGDALDFTVILALPSAEVTMSGGSLTGNDISLIATATVDVLVTSVDFLDGSITVGAVTAISSADVTVDGASSIVATGALTITATSDVTTEVTRAPEDDGDAMDTDTDEDAAIAISVVTSDAHVTIGGTATLNAGGAANISAVNTVDVTTTVDGQLGGDFGGGTLATSVVLGDTELIVQDSASITALNDVLLSALSNRTVTTTSTATTEGSTEDGDGGTMTEGQQALEDNDASTSDGDLSLAAAISVTTLTGETSARVTGGTIVSSTGNLGITSSATHTVSTIADSTTTAGDSGTGVGIGVAIGVVDGDSTASIGGTASLNANTINVSGLIPTSTAVVEAKSGPKGDASGADVDVAGALAINVTMADAAALVESGANNNVSGADLILLAQSETDSTAKAIPKEDGVTGESLGIGASVAINIPDHTTRAAIEDSAVVTGVDDLTVSAISDHDVTTEATTAAAGGTAVAAVVALVIANDDTIAELGTGSTLVTTGNVTLTADHTGSVQTKAKGDAEGTGSAAIGAGLALNTVNENTEARTARGITAGGDVTIKADSSSDTAAEAEASAQGAEGESSGGDDVDTQADNQRTSGDTAAGNKGARDSSETQSTPTSDTDDSDGESSLTVAAAISINVSENVTRASIAAGQTITAGGTVMVSASANSDAAADADASATQAGSVGIAAAVAINVADVTNEAIVHGGAVVHADGLTVRATMRDVSGNTTHTFSADAMPGVADGDIGIAGSVTINIVDTTTRAVVLTGATVDLANQDLVVMAAADTDSTSTAKPEDEGGGGTDVGIGGSFALNVITNLVVAEIEDGVTLTGTGQIWV